MISYELAKERAKAFRSDWNEREYIAKAVITWVDGEYEYDLEIKNNERMENSDFSAWVEEEAVELAKAEAERFGTVFEEIDRIDYETDIIDDDELFDKEYNDWAEFEWECENDR